MQETFLQKFGKLEERSEKFSAKKEEESNSPEMQKMNIASQSDATTAITGVNKSGLGIAGALLS